MRHKKSKLNLFSLTFRCVPAGRIEHFLQASSLTLTSNPAPMEKVLVTGNKLMQSLLTEKINFFSLSLSLSIYIYIYIYMCVCVCVCVCVK